MVQSTFSKFSEAFISDKNIKDLKSLLSTCEIIVLYEFSEKAWYKFTKTQLQFYLHMHWEWANFPSSPSFGT